MISYGPNVILRHGIIICYCYSTISYSHNVQRMLITIFWEKSCTINFQTEYTLLIMVNYYVDLIFCFVAAKNNRSLLVYNYNSVHSHKNLITLKLPFWVLLSCFVKYACLNKTFHWWRFMVWSLYYALVMSLYAFHRFISLCHHMN